MRDLFIEIWESVRRNILRTCLTGFAVAWGIFMLIVLLGAGNGLMNALLAGSQRISVNSMMIGGGYTSRAYGGLQSGRHIELEAKDAELVMRAFPKIVENITATISLSQEVVYQDNSVSVQLQACYPEYMANEGLKLQYGRFINRKDLEERRKVVVITDQMAEIFTGSGSRVSSMLGRMVKCGGINFMVIGILKSDMSSYTRNVYAPFTSVSTIFNRGKYVDELTFTFHGLETEEENEIFEQKLRAIINTAHKAAPDDNRAIWIWNRFTQSLQMAKGTDIISTALWIIGLLTLLSGIVGVSNIMLITVKERTREFGVRKAIGASPWNITRLILAESITITAFFGYVGMFFGLVACEILDMTLGRSSLSVLGQEISVFVNPTVGVDAALGATIVLIISGAIAGLFPAMNAAKVRPIEALRAE
jgi:putative ABC transport system permease protein